MSKGLKTFGSLVALFGTGLLLLLPTRSATINYRVKVAIDDNGTERVGSSVWQYKLHAPIPLIGNSYGPEFRGEAVIVDVPGRGTLVVVLRSLTKKGHLGSNEIMMMPEGLFGRDVVTEYSIDSADRVRVNRQIAKLHGRTRDLSPPPDTSTVRRGGTWPYVLKLADIRDPASAVPVNPARLDESFGAGVRFKSVSIEITDDPISRGLDVHMPWLREYYTKHLSLDGQKHDIRIDNDILKNLGAGEFSTEVVR